MDWLGGLSGWSGFFTLLFTGDALIVLTTIGGLLGVLIAALRSRGPVMLRLTAMLIAAGFAALVLAWVFEWIE